jgi:hypothetical protein
MYRLTWRLPLAGLVAFSHLQFSQIRGRQPYSIVRKIPYLIRRRAGATAVSDCAVLDGGSREEAAKIGGMDHETPRDWVIRFNE